MTENQRILEQIRAFTKQAEAEPLPAREVAEALFELMECEPRTSTLSTKEIQYVVQKVGAEMPPMAHRQVNAFLTARAICKQFGLTGRYWE